MRAFPLLGAFLLSLHHLPARADRDAGAAVFFSANCIACHAIECNRSGPKLGGLVGRRAGSVGDFSGYSEAMKQSDITWSEEALDAFLADPAGYVPGTAMAGVEKVENAQERRDLIDFLKDPDTSMDLCR